MPELELQTALALVTGAGSGIGKNIAEALLARGTRVIPQAWRDVDILVNNAGHDRGGRQAFRNSGIRVTEILPGLVETEFGLRRWDNAEKAEKFYAGFDSVLHPEDVAGAVIYALDQPKHVNVAQLVIVPCGQE